MHLTILLSLFLSAAAPADGEVTLTIFRDPYSSSEQSTLCRVRAVNHGGRRWSGKSLRFEARAVDGGDVVRERGRFGLELAPYGSLETLIAFTGRHDRFEVRLLPARKTADDEDPRSPKKKGSRRKRGHSRRR